MSEIEIQFPSSSSYSGSWDGRMNGYGVYTYPDGTEYHGNFKNGVFHGTGKLITPTKFCAFGEFSEGKCVKYNTFEFDDGLDYKPENWNYCTKTDRRFAAEIKNGIPPVGDSYKTKEKPPRKIPKGFYDVEEGFFNPLNGAIYDAETGIYIRNACKSQCDWFKKYCRYSGNRNFGPNKEIIDLNSKVLDEVNETLENDKIIIEISQEIESSEELHDCECVKKLLQCF